MRFLRAIALLCLLSTPALTQTTTTVTGLIKSLSGSVVPAGQVTFELRPGLDSTISGSARFVPSTVTCSINQATAGASAAVRLTNSVTISGLTGHTFVANDVITVAGMTDSSFNGTFTIGSVGASTITYPQTAGNATTGSGTISALRSSPGPGSCTITMNSALTPSGTSYRICIQANFVTPGSCFNDYAILSTKDLTTVVPTPTTSPAFTFVDLHSAQTIDGNKTFTGSTSFTGTLTFGALTVATINANAVVSRTANPASAGFIELATTDTECWRNAANGGDVCLSDVGVAAAGTGNLADLLKWTGGGLQASAYVDRSAAPAQSGVVRTGNAVTAVAARNQAAGADLALLASDASNNVVIAPPIKQVEQVAPSGVASSDLLYADSTAHRWKMNNNNGGAVQVVASGADISTTDTVTKIQGTAVSAPTGTGAVVLATAPTVTNMIQNTGVAQGSGHKHQRTSGCTTAASVNATCTSTLTWTNAFADTNYTVACFASATANQGFIQMTTKSASALTLFGVSSNTSAFTVGAFECIADHD